MRENASGEGFPNDRRPFTITLGILLKTDIIIAGGGPAGLSAAEVAARRGISVVVLEQNHEIGSPIRTSGGR